MSNTTEDLDTYCAVCFDERGKAHRQYQSQSGATCYFGHGGAAGLSMSEMVQRGFNRFFEAVDEPDEQPAEEGMSDAQLREVEEYLGHGGDYTNRHLYEARQLLAEVKRLKKPISTHGFILKSNPTDQPNIVEDQPNIVEDWIKARFRCFLYVLMRDHLPTGVVHALIKEHVKGTDNPVFSAVELEMYAERMVNEALE